MHLGLFVVEASYKLISGVELVTKCPHLLVTAELVHCQKKTVQIDTQLYQTTPKLQVKKMYLRLPISYTVLLFFLDVKLSTTQKYKTHKRFYVYIGVLFLKMWLKAMKHLKCDATPAMIIILFCSFYLQGKGAFFKPLQSSPTLPTRTADDSLITTRKQVSHLLLSKPNNIDV